MASQEYLTALMNSIKNNDQNEKRIETDYTKYTIYNGDLRKKIEQIIKSEFKKPETITELTNRIVPINIMKRIVNKLAKVYKAGAIREPLDLNDADADLISVYSDSFMITHRMNFCNKMVKNTKHALLEPYLDIYNIPRLRVLPSHTYFLHSENKINPEQVTAVIKNLDVSAKDSKEQRFAYWDNENHWIIDGDGNIMYDSMYEMNNETGINPYGVLPFVHVKEQEELLYPIQANDVLSVQIAVCLLLSDSTLAQKYLSWATLVLLGAEGDQKVEVGPAAILSLEKNVDGQNPDAKYIQPNLNSDEVIRLVEKLIEFLLATNSLSPSSMNGNIGNDPASGIAKLLDNIESTEDINDQRLIYSNAEKELWDKFAHYILPYWVETKQINPDFAGSFSQDFILNIRYPEYKMLETKTERIRNAKEELTSGTTSLKRAIQSINPDMTPEEIEALIEEIRLERLENVKFMERNINGTKES